MLPKIHLNNNKKRERFLYAGGYSGRNESKDAVTSTETAAFGTEAKVSDPDIDNKPMAPLTEQLTEQPMAPLTDQPMAPLTEQPMAPLTEQPIVPLTEQPIVPPMEPLIEQNMETQTDDFVPETYSYLSDKILQQWFHFCSDTLSETPNLYKTRLCMYGLNESCTIDGQNVLPFLQFLMKPVLRDQDQDQEQEQFTFPSFDYECVNSFDYVYGVSSISYDYRLRKSPNHGNIDENDDNNNDSQTTHFLNQCFTQILEIVNADSVIHAKNIKIDDLYKGFVEYEDIIYVVFDCSQFIKTPIQNHTWAVIDELLYKRSIFGTMVDKTIVEFFEKHPFMSYIKNENSSDSKEYDFPFQLYMCKLDESGKYKNVSVTNVEDDVAAYEPDDINKQTTSTNISDSFNDTEIMEGGTEIFANAAVSGSVTPSAMLRNAYGVQSPSGSGSIQTGETFSGDTGYQPLEHPIFGSSYYFSSNPLSSNMERAGMRSKAKQGAGERLNSVVPVGSQRSLKYTRFITFIKNPMYILKNISDLDQSIISQNKDKFESASSIYFHENNPPTILKSSTTIDESEHEILPPVLVDMSPSPESDIISGLSERVEDEDSVTDESSGRDVITKQEDASALQQDQSTETNSFEPIIENPNALNGRNVGDLHSIEVTDTEYGTPVKYSDLQNPTNVSNNIDAPASEKEFIYNPNPNPNPGPIITGGDSSESPESSGPNPISNESVHMPPQIIQLWCVKSKNHFTQL